MLHFLHLLGLLQHIGVLLRLLGVAKVGADAHQKLETLGIVRKLVVNALVLFERGRVVSALSVAAGYH